MNSSLDELQHVKRLLRIGDIYSIREPFGATPPELRSERIRVLVQLPDGHLPGGVLAVEGIIQSGRHEGERFYVQARLLHSPGGNVCRCRAYNWPHRAGGGLCFAFDAGPFCGDCGKPTEVRSERMDTPNGRWEWTDRSSCCEAELYDDPELKQPFGE
jgi:hypothetical protein